MALVGYTITVIAKQDNPYNILPETDISIRKVSDNSLVNIYSDEAGLIPIAQLGAKTDSNGQFTFYADASLGVLKAVWTNGGVIATEVLDQGDHSRLANRNAFGAHDLQAISGLTEPSDLAQRHRIETTVAEIATGVFNVGDKLIVTDRNNAKFNVISGVADGFSRLVAGVGKIAEYKADRSEVWLEHLGGLAGTDVTAHVNAWKLYAKDNNVKAKVGSGLFTITDEIDFSTSINMECVASNSYRDEGTVWIIDVNNPAKFGFWFGKSDKVISPNVRNLKCRPVSACAASAYINCATFNGGGFIFDSNSNSYNGLLVEDWYIGEISGIEGSGANYMLKISGNTSGLITNVNAGSVDLGVGSYSVQISSLKDGSLRLRDIYLEAQSRRNLIITDCNETSTVEISGVYEETQSFPIVINNSNAVTIKNYRTNLADKGIEVSNSRSVSIEVVAVGAFEKNPAVKVIDDSDVSVSVVYNNFSSSLVDGRDYTLVEGELSGHSTLAASGSVNLLPSANLTVAPFTDGTVVTEVPTNLTQRVSNKSISLTAGQVLNMPLLSMKVNKRYAIKLVYKSSGGENACLIRMYDGALPYLKTFTSFTVAGTEFRTLTFIFEAPSNQVNRYDGLVFENVSGTAVVHHFGMCEIDSGYLPSRLVNDETVISRDIDLSVSKLIAISPSISGLKVSRYEMQYQSASTAGASVEVGVITAAGGMSKYCTFTSSAKNIGELESSMAFNVGLKDQLITERGLGVNVTGGGTGIATVYVYLNRADAPTTIA